MNTPPIDQCYEKSYEEWFQQKMDQIQSGLIHILHKNNNRIVFYVNRITESVTISYYKNHLSKQPELVNRVLLETARQYWKKHKKELYRHQQ
jgi:hypothetical protein